MSKRRSKSSGRWLDRQRKDQFVQRAQSEGWRSRAVYKLEALDQRDKLIRPGQLVVDLGAAPGGWSEYVAARQKGRGRCVAIDILPMDPIAGVEVLQGDFLDADVEADLRERLGGMPVDLVLSDMAPNFSGVPTSDQWRSIELAELARDFALQVLGPQGGFVVKLFQGEGFDDYVKATRGLFERVVTRKPQASRAESREVYLLASRPKPGLTESD